MFYDDDGYEVYETDKEVVEVVKNETEEEMEEASGAWICQKCGRAMDYLKLHNNLWVCDHCRPKNENL